ncbi:MAG: aldehyde dehydrogenase family protein, partial [Bdellovibrionales bacterium]
MSVQTINPATEEVLASYGLQSENEVHGAVDAAHSAYGEWRRMSLESRLACAKDFAAAVHSARVPMAELMTREMGKPLKDALSEVDKCVVSVQYLAENFPKWHSELVHELPKGYSVTRDSLGVILGIMPWNFPLWQAVRFAVPAILCGNTVLLKHSPNTWGSAEMMGDLFNQAFPSAVYCNLKIDVPLVTKILDDFRVRGVSLTGSVRAGRSVGELAGARLKKCVLELGGSDAYVILD